MKEWNQKFRFEKNFIVASLKYFKKTSFFQKRKPSKHSQNSTNYLVHMTNKKWFFQFSESSSCHRLKIRNFKKMIIDRNSTFFLEKNIFLKFRIWKKSICTKNNSLIQINVCFWITMFIKKKTQILKNSNLNWTLFKKLFFRIGIFSE